MGGHISLELVDNITSAAYHRIADKASIKALKVLEDRSDEEYSGRVLYYANGQLEIAHLQKLEQALHDRLLDQQVELATPEEYKTTLDDSKDV